MQSKDIVKAADSDCDHFADKKKNQLLTSDLRWTVVEIAETHYRLMTFKDDWDAPGMEAYDEL